MTEPQENSAALRQLTFENAVAINALRAGIESAVQQLVIPLISAQGAIEERVARTEASLERAAQMLELTSQLTERNTRDIAALESFASQRQASLARAEKLIEQNAQLVQIMLDENRAARAKWQARI